MPKPTFLTLSEVAAILGVTRLTAYRRFWSGGDLTACGALVDGHPRVDLAKFEALRGHKLTQAELAAARDRMAEAGRLRAQRKLTVMASLPNLSSLAA